MKFRTLGLAGTGTPHRAAARRAAARRVESWTRSRFNLPPGVVVTVSQIACGVPGCPPIETVVMFWTAQHRRHQFKVFKPLGEVQPDDLPPSWMRDALAAPDGAECGCC